MARLNKTEWMDAGFRALVTNGAGAVRVEPIARDLGATKGSFYWHFKDLNAFHHAMLEYWETAATQFVIDQLAPLPTGEAKLRALISIVSNVPAEQGGSGVEAAIRGWARSFEQAKHVLARVDDTRIDFVRACFAEMGVTPADSATVFYATYLGLEELALSGRQVDYTVLDELLDRLLS